MAQYKVYRLNNYIYAENQDNNRLLEGHAKEVQITQGTLASDTYIIHQLGDIERLQIGDILKEDGTPYTKAEFDLWYTENTGFNTALGGSGAVTGALVDINDQASSGYIDIGTMRMQWGTDDTGVAGTRTITLPAPFANTTYSVVSEVSRTASPTGKAVTNTIIVDSGSFTVLAGSNSSAANLIDPIMWQAIGLKP